MSSSIIALLKKDQLTGKNYATWKSKLNMILVIADLCFVLMEECSPFPTKYASQSVRDAYDCWTKANDKVRNHILASMSDILSKKHEIMVTAREKEGKGKGPIIVVKGKGKAKVVIKGKCFHYNVDEHWKTNCPKYLVKKKEKEGATNHVCSSLQETSSFKQLEESEMTLKVGTGDVILARAVGDAKLVKNGLLNKLEDDSLPPSESCLERKMTKRPFTGKGYRAKEPLELIHSDLCGPMNVKARGGFEYFISFIDDYSSKKIKILRSDRGGEYMDLRFQDYMIEHGIQSQLSAPGTPQQNGVSERRNRTLLDMVRSMMSYAQLSSSFWGYVVQTAVHILNNVPSKSVSETPFELWRGRKPSLSHFRIWGCPAYVLVTNPKKLEPHSRLCQFFGYPKETRGGLFFDPQENRVFVSTNATFLEEDQMRDHKPRSKLVLNEATDESTRVVEEVGSSSRVDETTTSSQSHPSQSLIMPRRSGRIVSQPNRYLGLTETQIVIPDDGVEDPLSYKQAMNDVDKDQWVKAMDLEMESMYFNSVWELVDLPEGVIPIGCKWIYKRKRDSARTVQTFKARLVAKGYTQREGVDYEETFSSVAMLKSIRILLSIATFYDYEIWQMVLVILVGFSLSIGKRIEARVVVDQLGIEVGLKKKCFLLLFITTRVLLEKGEFSSISLYSTTTPLVLVSKEGGLYKGLPRKEKKGEYTDQIKRREPNSWVMARRATHFLLDRQFQPTFFIREVAYLLYFPHKKIGKSALSHTTPKEGLNLVKSGCAWRRKKEVADHFQLIEGRRRYQLAPQVAINECSANWCYLFPKVLPVEPYSFSFESGLKTVSYEVKKAYALNRERLTYDDLVEEDNDYNCKIHSSFTQSSLVPSY
ncbi:gag/pol protein [Cucumis melo var. makuwa]|uniref:Gag/pol protein n=1 Tax=Cucumis melo var. makuwa TaxID=1194695 RepID=A0A5D3DWD1_CUCMM|nr:gag/pol protein [Cucumis melo var. makuwa]